jgi:hypothetical protein
MQEANVRIGSLHNLTIKLQNQSENAMGRRMLRTKVQSVVFNFCHVD